MRRTITWILYILMGVQIAFGCAYFVTNFSAGQQFAENYFSFVPNGIVTLVQLVLAAVSVWYFLGRMGFRENKYLRGYVCAFLLTVPYLLQLHMAKLVWSLSLSVFLWMLGLLMEIREDGVSNRRVGLLLGIYFLYGVICPDGLWLGGILLLFGSFFYFRGAFDLTGTMEKVGQKDADARVLMLEGQKDVDTQVMMPERKRIGQKVRFRLTVCLVAGVIFLVNMGLNGALPEQRKVYRENNLGTAAVSRFVWPNFATNYFFWDDEVKAVLSEERAIDLCQRIDLLEKEFYPTLVETYGSRKATRLCLEMGYRCLMDRSKETVLEIGKDFVDYLLIPFTIEKNLQGKGVSLTAWNYGRMKAHTPLLVKYYYRYGTFELPFLLLWSLLLWWFQRTEQISQWIKQRTKNGEVKRGFNIKGEGGGISVQWKLLLFTWILYTLWYTMRSNLPIDYKPVLPILFIWYLASVGGLLCQKAEN